LVSSASEHAEGLADRHGGVTAVDGRARVPQALAHDLRPALGVEVHAGGLGPSGAAAGTLVGG